MRCLFPGIIFLHVSEFWKLLFGFLHRWIFKRRVRFLVIEVFLWFLQIAANCWMMEEKKQAGCHPSGQNNRYLKKASEKLESFMDLRHTVPTSVICVASCGVFFFYFFLFFCQNDKTTKKKEEKKAFNATTMDSTVVKRGRVWKENCRSSTLHLKNSLGPTFLLHPLFRDTFVFSPFVILSASSCNFDEELPC